MKVTLPSDELWMGNVNAKCISKACLCSGNDWELSELGSCISNSYRDQIASSGHTSWSAQFLVLACSQKQMLAEKGNEERSHAASWFKAESVPVECKDSHATDVSVHRAGKQLSGDLLLTTPSLPWHQAGGYEIRIGSWKSHAARTGKGSTIPEPGQRKPPIFNRKLWKLGLLNPASDKVCWYASNQPSRGAKSEQRSWVFFLKKDDCIQILGNALFTVWVSPCMTVSQTGRIPVTFERHFLSLFFCLLSFRTGMCFAAESDVQVSTASHPCTSLICVAPVAQVIQSAALSSNSVVSLLFLFT